MYISYHQKAISFYCKQFIYVSLFRLSFKKTNYLSLFLSKHCIQNPKPSKYLLRKKTSIFYIDFIIYNNEEIPIPNALFIEKSYQFNIVKALWKDSCRNFRNSPLVSPWISALWWGMEEVECERAEISTRIDLKSNNHLMTEKFLIFKGNLEISAKSELKLRNAVNNTANRWFISS